jgi:hypothetical protein
MEITRTNRRQAGSKASRYQGPNPDRVNRRRS